MKPPETKTELRQMLGFFSYFWEYIPNFAKVAKPMTDLTAKHVPIKIPWGDTQTAAFECLKDLLCKATTNPLYIFDFSKGFNVFVDASASAVSGVITQTDPNGNELPTAFFSTKMNSTQSS